MSCPRCPHFDSCSAPLCSEDPASLMYAVWFGDEEVCRRADYRAVPIVRVQRRIARLTGGELGQGCFTAPMLGQGCRLTRVIRGLDPEAGPISPDRVARWLRDHPTKRSLTEQERADRGARISKMRGENTGSGTKPGARTQGPVPPAVQTGPFSAGAE
jgi:hypothetical protein